MKVLSSIALTGAWRTLKPLFEARGHAIELAFGTGGAVNQRVAEGEPGDVVVSPSAGIERLIAEGKVMAGSSRAIASSGVGVAVRKGAARPDISSVEALRRTLLAAKCVAYSDPAGGGGSGIHFAKVLEQLGIAAEINARAKRGSGVLNGEVVAKGDADLAIQQIPELTGIGGIDIVGPLPASLQHMTSFSAGLLTASKDRTPAHALIEFLSSSEAGRLLTAAGFEVQGITARTG